MKKVNIVVILVTLFAVFYNISPYIGIPGRAILFMFCIAPFLVVYMAYVILKHGTPSGNTFNERFYEDYAAK